MARAIFGQRSRRFPATKRCTSLFPSSLDSGSHICAVPVAATTVFSLSFSQPRVTNELCAACVTPKNSNADTNTHTHPHTHARNHASARRWLAEHGRRRAGAALHAGGDIGQRLLPPGGRSGRLSGAKERPPRPLSLIYTRSIWNYFQRPAVNLGLSTDSRG